MPRLRHRSAYAMIFATAMLSPDWALGANRFICDGLPEVALTREAISISTAEIPPSLGTESHIDACRKALDDKKIASNSPRLISLLQSKLLSAVMAGSNLGADEFLLDQAKLRITLDSARAKLAASPDNTVLQKLLKNTPGPEGMTAAEIDRFKHLSRLIALLGLNRVAKPDQAAVDKLLAEATDELSPFDLVGLRELAAVASMTVEVSEADRRVYRRYANLHPRGYLAWANALYADRRFREAFDTATAFSRPYFEYEATGRVASSDQSTDPVSNPKEPEGEDYGGQALRIDINALATDIVVTLNPSTPDERRPWITRTVKYFELLAGMTDIDKSSSVKPWEKLFFAEALISTAAPYNLFDSATLVNNAEWAKSQAALRKSQYCGLLGQETCYSWARSEIASRLLAQEFAGKDAVFLNSVTAAMENGPAHRRHYLRYFQGISPQVKSMFASPIRKSDEGAALTGALAGLDKGSASGGAVDALALTILVPRSGQNEAALLNQLWRVAGYVAQKNKKTHVSLPLWFSGDDNHDPSLRKFFSQKPADQPYVVATFVMLNADQQPEAERKGVRSASFEAGDVNRLGPLNAADLAVAEQAVLE